MQSENAINRRDLLQTAAGAGALALGVSSANGGEQVSPASSSPTRTMVDAARLIWRNRQPGMEYARLGRTNYMASRIVSGAQGQERHWRMMIVRGMNYFDTGGCYANGSHEAAMGKLLKDHADRIWVTSKASGIVGFERVDPAQVCSSCGTCKGVCHANVPIDRLLGELSADMVRDLRG